MISSPSLDFTSPFLVDGPTGPGNVANINVVTDFAKSGLLDSSKLTCGETAGATPGVGVPLHILLAAI